MRPTLAASLVLIGTFVVTASAAEDPETNRLIVCMRSGEAVVGRATSRLSLNLRYSQVEIPWSAISRVSMNEDKESAVVWLNIGDRFTGYPEAGAITLTESNVRTVPYVQIASVVAAPPGPAKGLVACYRFDDDSGREVRDASGLGNDGKFEGGAGRGSEGTLIVDGSSGLVRVADAMQLDTDQAFSLAAWINPVRYTSDRGLDYPGFILAKWYTATEAGDYYLGLTSLGRLQLYLANNEKGYRDATVTSDAVIPCDEWTHVAATFQDATVQLFVNGRPESSQSVPFHETWRGEYLHDEITIGGLWNDSYLFHGKIDDVRIYNRVLSDQEVSTLARRQMAE